VAPKLSANGSKPKSTGQPQKGGKDAALKGSRSFKIITGLECYVLPTDNFQRLQQAFAQLNRSAAKGRLLPGELS